MNQQRCSERREVSADGSGLGQGDGAEVVELASFTPEQRERLIRLRRQVVRGERSDSFPVDKRQDFVRWLIARGRLSDNSR
jgi:hypothetical protein